MVAADISDEGIHQLLRDAQQRLSNTKRNQEILPQAENTRSASLQQSISSVPLVRSVPSYIKSTTQGSHVEPAHLTRASERTAANGTRRIEYPLLIKTTSTKDKRANAGSDWYNLPRTTLTPELKRDLQLLQMRSVLDGKRHYKKDGLKPQIPEFSQIGTIIEGPTEFYSARLSNRERKRTFVEEVLAGENATHRFRSKYTEIQGAKTSGGKAHYKKMKAERRMGGSKG